MSLPAVALLAWLAPAAFAQEYREPEGAPLPDYARVLPVTPGAEKGFVPPDNGLPSIMLTGYWPPTNEMLRRFSTSPTQNPEGWIGENWEGRGYNVYAFFPEFPGGLGKGEGDFEVDYQDTSADFWPLAEQVSPLAIITFGRAAFDTKWEMEWRTRNLSSWVNDYQAPTQPTPSPPDGSVPPGTIRYSTLPMAEIAKAVGTAGLGIVPYVDTTGDAGAFLCEYIGYHACWYHDLHTEPYHPDHVVAAGHIHVGYKSSLDNCIAATEITVRTLIDYLDEQLLPDCDYDGDGDVDLDDYAEFADCLSGPSQAAGFVAPSTDCLEAFDFYQDGDIDERDFLGFQELFTGGR